MSVKVVIEITADTTDDAQVCLERLMEDLGEGWLYVNRAVDGMNELMQVFPVLEPTQEAPVLVSQEQFDDLSAKPKRRYTRRKKYNRG